MYKIGDAEVEAVRRVIESRQLFRYRGGEGGETDRFEKEWADLVGAKYALAMSSGTAALICGLVGLEVGPGDEVIVPAYTFMATALAVTAAGAIPVLADVDESLTIDPVDVEKKITPRTKAIIPVDMLGLPCNMDAIMDVAKRHNLHVVEDACQADGGSYKGKRLGSIGDAGAFSFNHFKIISCGEGGALVTDQLPVYQRALVHHDGGAVFRGHAEDIKIPMWAGLNFRITEILSAILRSQLSRLDGILTSLRNEKRRMIEGLSGIDSFTFSPVHDVEGDCGSHLALLFESAGAAQAAVSSLESLGSDCWRPLDTDRHVYTNWEPIMAKRGAHHPKLNPWEMSESTVEYSKDMCSRTLDILGRTVCILTQTDRSDAELDTYIERAKEALSGAAVAKAG